MAEIICFIEGPLVPVDRRNPGDCEAVGSIFDPVWEDAEVAPRGVYDRVAFADLVERDKEARNGYVASYCI